MGANIMQTANAFDTLTDLDDGHKDNVEQTENVPNMINIAIPIHVGPRENDKQTPTVPTKSKYGKQTLTLATNKVVKHVSSSLCVHVGDDSESDVEDVFDETGDFMTSKQSKMVVVM
ncbi:hypothetical protein Tco_0938649 [Tanacetum coccineum]|uniref:Uncharacterized protein n=1 Tax=Tanacetum coccineum TaxID=301880 RepID=A0ABQ5DPT3_9ASTR